VLEFHENVIESAHIYLCMYFVYYEIPRTKFPSQSFEFPRTSNNYKGGLPQAVPLALLQHWLKSLRNHFYKGGLPQAVPHALLQHSPVENVMCAQLASLSGSPQHDRGRRPTWWTTGGGVIPLGLEVGIRYIQYGND
jgi:hypothetical protein